MQTEIPCTLMRAGTSRGPFFLKDWLPAEEAARNAALVGAIGSMDSMPIDGLGGGNSLTSKVAIVSQSVRPGCDLDYLFAQVGFDPPSVDTRPNCGNMLAGVLPFAIERGLIKPRGDTTTARVFNVNTSVRVDATVSTPGGQLTYAGNARIDGVSTSAAPIYLHFVDAWGAGTGALFPTGNRKDVFDGIEVTCIDAAMPLMIVKAEALGVTGREPSSVLDSNAPLLQKLEQLRQQAGRAMGLGDVSNSVIPKPVLVSPTGDPLAIRSRYFTPKRCHTSHAVTGAIGVASAFLTPGTVATRAELPTPGRHLVSVRHPVGEMSIAVDVTDAEGGLQISGASVMRTVRKIFEGTLYLPAISLV
jgi:2-methylaconitate cis-trans-isomerase PrpF